MKRLLDYDPVTGIRTYHDYDAASDTTYIEEVEDCAPLIAKNKALQNADVGGAKGLNEYSRAGIKKGWWHVASVPATVIMKWRAEHGINLFDYGRDPGVTRKVNRLLQDPEYRYLRTGTGRL